MTRVWVALLGCAVALSACSEPSARSLFSPSASAGTPSGGATASDDDDDAGFSSGGVAAVTVGASAAADASAAANAGAAGASSARESPADAGFCTGQAVSVAELASGNVRAGATVLLSQLVASSQKFLLSASKTSGKCLWGAFAAELGASGENSGVLLLSSADGVLDDADAGSELRCPTGADSLPDDLAPGDRLSAFGDFSDYTPSACRDTAPMRELLIKPGCAVTRSGPGTPPPVALISAALADQLAQGKDKALLRAWSGARVELDDIDALAVAGSTSAVGPFGVIKLQQTQLELHSKVPYADLSEGGPHQPGKSLDISFPVHFARAAGVVFLDYCTWSLELCDRCSDLSPQSRDCPASGG